MNAEHFPFQSGDNVTLFGYTSSSQVSGQLLDVDEHGVTVFHTVHGLMAWRPWANIAGASAQVPPLRVAEVIAESGRRAAYAATGVRPADTVDAPPPA